MAGQDNSRYGAAATAAPVLTASARPRRRRVKVFAQAFFKRLVGVRGRRPCGLSRLRQTQEGRKGFLRKAFRRGLRFRSGRSWARATGTQDPSSGGAGARWAPFSADRAGRRDFLGGPTARRGLPQASLPCPRKRVPSFGTSGRKGQARCHRDRLCGKTIGGHSSPLFLCMGRQGLRVSAAASVGPERCPPGTRTPCNPETVGLRPTTRSF